MKYINCDKVEEDLLDAVRAFNAPRVKELLKLKDIKVNFKHSLTSSTPQRSILEIAANLGVSNNRWDIVKTLLDDPRVEISLECVCYAFTGVFNASYLLSVSKANIFNAEDRGFPELIKVLAACDRFDVNATGFGDVPLFQQSAGMIRGCSMLGIAAAGGLIEVVKLLLDVPNLDVGKSNVHGDCPISLAMIRGCTETAKIILADPRVDVNKCSNAGTSILLQAVTSNNVEIVKLLLERKNLDVNAADHKGTTPLMKCLAYSSAESADIAQALLNDMRTDVNKVNSAGQSPLWYAAAQRNDAVMKTLLRNHLTDMTIRPYHNNASALDRYLKAPHPEPDILALFLNREMARLNTAGPNSKEFAVERRSCQILVSGNKLPKEVALQMIQPFLHHQRLLAPEAFGDFLQNHTRGYVKQLLIFDPASGVNGVENMKMLLSFVKNYADFEYDNERDMVVMHDGTVIRDLGNRSRAIAA